MARAESGGSVFPDGRRPVKFVSAPSDALICPIHLGLFVDPTIARCGHTFCRECIVESLAHMAQCPLDAQPLDEDAVAQLIPNLTVKAQIEDLRVYCPFGLRKLDGRGSGGTLAEAVADGRGEGLAENPDAWVVDEDGCPETVRMGDLDSHEATCTYRWVPCPNSEDCGLMRASALRKHLKGCRRMACKNVAIGCGFSGSRAEVDAHLGSCKFEATKDIMAVANSQFETLKAMLLAKDEQIAALTDTVVHLSRKLDNLAGNIELKLDTYDQTICKMHIAIEDARRQAGVSLDEITMVKQRIGSDGDSQIYPHLYKCKGTMTGHTGPVWTLVANDTTLFSGSSDSTIRAWSIATYQSLHVIEGHQGIVHALVLYSCALGDFLISGGDDCTIRVVDLATYQTRQVIDTLDNAVCSLAVHNNRLFAGTLKQISVFDLDTLDEDELVLIHELKPHNHWLRAIIIHEDTLWAGSYNTIHAWDLNSFECRGVLKCNHGSVYSLAVTGPYLVVGAYENSVLVFDRDTYECVATLSGHLGTVYSVIAINGYIITGSYDQTIKIRNVTGPLTNPGASSAPAPEPPTEDPSPPALSQDQAWPCVQTLVRHTSSVDALLFVHGKLFSASADHSIKVWS